MSDKLRLSPEEISKAASLADELQAQDTERESTIKAAEEIGIPREYLNQAAAEIQKEKVQRTAQSQRRKKIGLVAAIVAVAAISVNGIVAHNNAVQVQQDETASKAFSRAMRQPAPVDPFSNIADYQIASVNIVPLPQNTPIVLSASPNTAKPTALKFENEYDKGIEVSQLGQDGHVAATFSLAPREEKVETTSFGTPWLVTDGSGNNIGVFFPPSTPSVAVIPEPAVLSSLAAEERDPARAAIDYPSLLTPLDSSAPNKSNSKSGAPTQIYFASLLPREVELYRIGADGSQSKAQPLEPGESLMVDTTTTDTWFVVDNDQNILYRFRGAPVSKTAILWPKG